MKLWSKENTSTSQLIEEFTVGRDKEFDILLAEHDVLGSMAHVRMLGKVGLMNEADVDVAIRGLESILETIRQGNFKIEDGVEDVHSQVEFLLTERIGEAGKKIHSGRSRNDQVAVDVKLFLRAEIKSLTTTARTPAPAGRRRSARPPPPRAVRGRPPTPGTAGATRRPRAGCRPPAPWAPWQGEWSSAPSWSAERPARPRSPARRPGIRSDDFGSRRENPLLIRLHRPGKSLSPSGSVQTQCR